MPSRFQDMLKKQRQNAETSRAGLKWEQAEDDQLLSMVLQDTSVADIAKTLQRTEGSIKTRLIMYAVNKMEKENMSLQQVAQLVKLNESDITDYQEKKTVRDERRQNKFKKISPRRQYTDVSNVEIYDMLCKVNRNVERLLNNRA
jgi:hypothetical protein